jgi:hypothetical protein
MPACSTPTKRLTYVRVEIIGVWMLIQKIFQGPPRAKHSFKNKNAVHLRFENNKNTQPTNFGIGVNREPVFTKREAS